MSGNVLGCAHGDDAHAVVMICNGAHHAIKCRRCGWKLLLPCECEG